ncbi:M23 family metallopeptidase [Chitinophaga sedimenti]|uniref:peptidoglycan DD-metalloendopeptidase family protein n=1 Tax=Chitinophaga sedimenti TaxID=2033606 RepID=UPI0020033298|nr:M23 family metallopeptidase [Chitinophaga sedimenti]MCK7557906.1 M23 family metallopeptidase [Chitinophaga sedimenti]
MGVIVSHGRYFTNYVHLNSYSVRKGDKVKTGQALGTVLFNVEENASLFQFEIYKDSGDNNMNPRLWLAPR